MSGPTKSNVGTVTVQYDDGTSQVLATRAVTSTIDIEKTLLSGDPWFINVYATSGGPRYKGSVTNETVLSIKGRGNTMTDDEWSIMVYQLLFSELKRSQRNNFFFEAQTIGGNDLIDDETALKALNIVRNPLMRQTIGSIPMTGAQAEDEEQFELFDWMRQLNDDRASLQELVEEESTARGDAERKNETAAKEAEAFEKKMQQEKVIQMKIYTVMINNMKEAYRRALRGEISEEEDLFNMNVVRSSLEAVKLDDLVKKTKKRKVAAPKKKQKKQTRPEPIEEEVGSDSEVKLADEILQEGDEEEEEIPDSQESPTKPKNESMSSPTKALKAKSLTSFRFGIGKSVKEEDEDEEIPTDVETDNDGGFDEEVRAGYEYDEDVGDSDRTIESDGETDADTDD